MTPLHAACGDYRYEVVRVLLEAGANVNAKAKSGHLPIHCVLARAYYALGTHRSLRGLTETLQELAAHGARWDTKADEMATGRHMIYLSFWPEQVIYHADDHWRRVAPAIRVCVMRWVCETKQGVKRTQIPTEEILKGLDATETYLHEATATKKTTHLHSVAIVGQKCTSGDEQQQALAG